MHELKNNNSIGFLNTMVMRGGTAE